MPHFISSCTQTRHSTRTIRPFTCWAFEHRGFGVVISKRSGGLVINGRLAPEARSDVDANYIREGFFLVLFREETRPSWLTRRNGNLVIRNERRNYSEKKGKKLKSGREEEVGEIERAAARRARNSHSIFSTAT